MAPRASQTAATSVVKAPGRRPRRFVVLVGGLVVLVVMIVVSLVLGFRVIPLDVAWQAIFAPTGENPLEPFVREGRVPRTFLAVMVGSSMAVAGALMQSLSRNPLADPGLLGVNTGAALAVALSVAILGTTSVGQQVWFALAGAALATVIVYLLGSSGRTGINPVRLVLAGAAVTAVGTGAISAVVLSNRRAFDSFRSWNVGTLVGPDLSQALVVTPFLVVGLVIAMSMAGRLNALSLGDDTARALGANVVGIRALGIVTVTLLCGAGTAIVGPIAFVGLVVPHVIRSLTGPDHRWILPMSMVGGAVLMLMADVAGRFVIAPRELEVSVMTALIGGPVLVLLVRNRRLMKL